MAKILFSLFSNINWLDNHTIDPFYEGFIESLIESGNSIMLLRTNNFCSNLHNNELHSYINKTELLKKAKDFDPDFIITANHNIPKFLLDNLDCKIIIWTSDSPSWYSDKDYIKNNISRYIFLHQGWNNIHTKACIEFFGAKESQNYCVGYATNIRAINLPFNSNIIFIGTIGYVDNLRNYLKYNCNNIKLKELQKIYNRIKISPFDKNENDKMPPNLNRSDFFYALTSNNRIKVLDNIVDLGLKIYGYPENFFEVTPFSMDLVFAFDYMPVTSIKLTEKLLNSSKIGINLYHAQAVTGFSWRVADIMASNSCLISPNKQDLQKLNPYIKIPTFETPEEAREICKKLLSDEVWRREIVITSQKSIEENGRFKHMFKKIEDIIQFKLIEEDNLNNKKSLITLNSDKFLRKS